MTNWLDDEIRRGQQAREVLDHPLYQEAFNTLRAELVQQWERSPARDTEGREKLWLMLKSLERVGAHLESHMVTGQLAAQERQSMLQRLNPWSGEQSPL